MRAWIGAYAGAPLWEWQPRACSAVIPRELPLGNGSFQVNFDRAYRLMDLYYPLAGLFAFGAFDATNPRVVATMEAVRTRLWMQREIGGCSLRTRLVPASLPEFHPRPANPHASRSRRIGSC